jgi:hypothetical protein
VPPHAPQVPGVRLTRSRPEHAKPALQVPLPPVPQQVCPEPPQVEQTSPEVPSTHEPAVHGVAPAQQVWPSPPQGPQVPAVPWAAFRPEHAKPVLHVPLGPTPQHACAEPPQVAQTLPPAFTTQEPAVHGVAPPQQAWPSPPHGPQVPAVPWAAFRPEQARPVLHVPAFPLPQQAWPEPPHDDVDEHTSPVADSMHERPVLHVPPPPKPPPGQHVWPEPPHALQVPPAGRPPPSGGVVKQPRPLWQLLPPQQASPAAPQLSQVPPANPVALQPRPVLQVLFAQQGWLEPPHAVQVAAAPPPAAAAAQTSEPVHWLPWQQAAPSLPQATQLPLVQREPPAVQ